MKNLALRSKGLMFLFLIFAMFSCHKDAPVRAVEKTVKSSDGIVKDRADSLCCGSFKVKTRSGGSFPFCFQIGYYDQTNTWQFSSCITSGNSFTINACHYSNQPLIIVLIPCGTCGGTIQPYTDMVLEFTDACNNTYDWSDPNCPAFAFGDVILPRPLPGYSDNHFYGHSTELSLCCH